MLFNNAFSVGIVFTTVFLFCGCKDVILNNANTEEDVVTSSKNTDTTLPIPESNTQAEGDYQTLYITIADTGSNYYTLRTAMAALNTASNLPIDTLHRYYNPTKKKIVLADNDEDEMYRGEYFPRRFPSVNLSLEYMATYSKVARPLNIGLIACISETQKTADSVLKLIKPNAPKAFVLKGEVFLGCMH